MATPFTSDNSTLDWLLLQWLEESHPSQGSAYNGRYGLIFLYCLSALLSVFGNMIVIIIISQSLGRRSHIAIYQMNLAMADLFMSVFCVPFTFTQAHIGYWAVSSFLCPLVLFLQLCFVNVSAYTNVAIGADRFSGVIFPLKWKPTANQRKAIIIGVWSLSAALALPEVVVGRSLPQDMGNVTQDICNEYWREQGEREVYTLLLFLMVLIIPLVALGIAYSCVVFTLWFRETPGNADIRRDRKRLASKKKVTRMLIMVVVMFGVCWLPLHMFNLILDFRPDLVYTSSEQSLQAVFFACHWVAMSHALVNPIIYIVADEDFRGKVLKLLTCQNPLCVRQKSVTVNGETRKSTFSRSSPRNRRTYGTSDVRQRGIGKGETREEEEARRRRSSALDLLENEHVRKPTVTRTTSEHGVVSLSSVSSTSSYVVDLQPALMIATLYMPGLKEATHGEEDTSDVSSVPHRAFSYHMEIAKQRCANVKLPFFSMAANDD